MFTHPPTPAERVRLGYPSGTRAKLVLPLVTSILMSQKMIQYKICIARLSSVVCGGTEMLLPRIISESTKFNGKKVGS